MAEVINLRQARKARVRRESEARANQNRILHGRTRAEKEHDAAQNQRLARALDGARRDPEGER